jgi:hypothetical protein
MELLRPLNDPAFATQSVAYTGTAGSVTGWDSGPQGVLVWCTSDAYIRVGNGVTATTADMPLPAGTPVPIYVPPAGTAGGTGGQWRVSAIQITAGGTMYAKPINIR